MDLKFRSQDIFFDLAIFKIGRIQVKIRSFKISEEAEFNRILQTYLSKAAIDRYAFLELAQACLERYPRKWYQRRKVTKLFLARNITLLAKQKIFDAIIKVNLGLDAKEFFEWLSEPAKKKFTDRFPEYAFSIIEGLKWTPDDLKIASMAQLRMLQEGASEVTARREFEAMRSKAKRHG